MARSPKEPTTKRSSEPRTVVIRRIEHRIEWHKIVSAIVLLIVSLLALFLRA